MNIHAGYFANKTFTADLDDPVICAQIDDFVAKEADSTPFHLTGWSRAIGRAMGVKTHYLVTEGANGIIAVLPCHVLRSKIFGDAVVSSAFAVGGGVLGAWPRLNDQMMTIGVIERCPVIEVRGGHLPEKGWELTTSRHVSFSKRLPEFSEDLLPLIPRKRRANIRRAMALGSQSRVGNSEQDLTIFYRVYAEAMRNLGTPVFPKKLFRAILDEFGSSAEIMTIRQAGKPVSSVLTFYHKGVAMPYWGGGTSRARALCANDFLYYELMRHALQNKGCTRFDFGRSRVGSGHAAYKESFGFSSAPLHYAHRIIRRGYVRDASPESPRYRLASRLWRRLPLPVAGLIGPMVSRGLG